jgi:hypothetical protein
VRRVVEDAQQSGFEQDGAARTKAHGMPLAWHERRGMAGIIIGQAAHDQWSHLSHFSSCFTVFVLQTPQGDVLEVAQGAFSAISWPQPYLCTTLVHMVAGEDMGAGKTRAHGVDEEGETAGDSRKVGWC